MGCDNRNTSFFCHVALLSRQVNFVRPLFWGNRKEVLSLFKFPECVIICLYLGVYGVYSLYLEAASFTFYSSTLDRDGGRAGEEVQKLCCLVMGDVTGLPWENLILSHL